MPGFQRTYRNFLPLDCILSVTEDPIPAGPEQGNRECLMRRIRSILILALVFILAGAVLTLENMNIISGVSKLWPMFPLIVGAGFLILFFERKAGDLALLYLGSALCQLSIFFFYLNFTSWAKLVTLWPVFLCVAGLSFLSIYFNSRIRFFSILGVSLVLLAGVFFLVFGVSHNLWPLSFVAFGGSLLVVNHYYLRK